MTKRIKKYKNRRLYDMDKSQYITMDELKQDVLNGMAFQVEDSTTGEDLTNATLLQIFVELELGSNPLLSTDMLRRLIMLSQNPVSLHFKSMLEQLLTLVVKSPQDSDLMEQFKQTQELWKQQFNQALSQCEALFKTR